MSLLTESSPPCSVTLGDGCAPTSVAVLDSDVYRDTRDDCPNCGARRGPETFVSVYEFRGGRFGVCLGCGEERTVWFTRVSEVRWI
jgi:hypothetical protein